MCGHQYHLQMLRVQILDDDTVCTSFLCERTCEGRYERLCTERMITLTLIATMSPVSCSLVSVEYVYDSHEFHPSVGHWQT